MSLRIETRALVAVLTDLLQTAASDAALGAIHGVLLHTVRGQWGDTPGKVDLLCGASTTGSIGGHTYTTCAGQLGPEPMLWDRDDVDALLGVLRPLAKKPDHAVELRLDGDDHVWIAEDPDLFGDRVTIRIPTRDPKDFPGRGLYRLLTTRQDGVHRDRSDGQLVEPERRTDLVPSRLVPFLQVAKRRNQVLQQYRAHQSQPIAIQIGQQYRGVIVTSDYLTGNGDTPDADVWLPEFPPEGDLPDVSALAEADSDATTEPEPAS